MPMGISRTFVITPVATAGPASVPNCISTAMWFVWECHQIVHLLYPDDMGVVFVVLYLCHKQQENMAKGAGSLVRLMGS